MAHAAQHVVCEFKSRFFPRKKTRKRKNLKKIISRLSIVPGNTSKYLGAELSCHRQAAAECVRYAAEYKHKFAHSIQAVVSCCVTVVNNLHFPEQPQLIDDTRILFSVAAAEDLSPTHFPPVS